MKNKDKRHIEVIITYCEKIDLILEEYNRDFLLYQESDSFQLSAAMHSLNW